ncbi:hypothetical protein [Mesobacillus harenae]|uniref:hypothetical protein n=1 Tax=Mesobacillus harenae TaxID=2213203 RepID=UPI00158122C2|nr:hypothetical protein [Mesobacillus harenae]
MKYFNYLALLMVSVLILAGCSSEAEPDQEVEATAVEREQLEVTFTSLNFTEETSELSAGFTSNLPKGTEIDSVTLVDVEGTMVKEADGIKMEEERATVAFEFKEEDRERNASDEYRLVLNASVNETANSELLADQVFGGSFAEMQGAYADSDHIRLSAGNEPNAYSIEIQSANQVPMPGVIFEAGEEEKEAEVQEEVKEEQEPEAAAPPDDTTYKTVNSTDLKQNYVAYMSEKIQVTGKVTQVIDNDPYAMTETSKSFLVNISDPNNYDADNSVWVEILDNPPVLFVDSIVTVQGTLLDTYTYDSVSGTRITVPYIMAGSITTR